MSIIGSNILAGSSGQGGAYEIEQSLRFDGSNGNLSRTFSASNRKTWTWSAWVKRAKLGANQALFSAGAITVGPGPYNYHHIQFNTDDKLNIVYHPNGTGTSVQTSARFRDPSAWYHIVAVWDTTQATASNRAVLYVNGERQTALDVATYSAQNTDGFINSTAQASGVHYLGRLVPNDSQYFGGYLAEVNFIDGSALDHEDFGELDDNGVWRPIRYAGSYTGNSFYLKFDAADVDGDSSGLGNDWTASAGISTSGTGTDVMSDTPTTNWCTLDPLTNGSDATLSDGNLSAYGNSSVDGGNSRSTFAVTSGKWYCEFDIVATYGGGYPQLGIMRQYDASRPNNGSPQSGYSSGMIYPLESVSYWPNGQRSINSVDTLNWGSTFTNGDTVSIALDGENGAVYFAKNGTWQNSGDPTSGSSKTGAALTWTDVRDYVFTIASYQGSDTDANFGQRAFAYTPPTGYRALNTANLPAPDIADGSKNFNTVLYTGDNTNQAITGVGFQPDWVWIKSRNNVSDHVLQDAVRGVQKYLKSNSTGTEGTDNGTITSFDSDGFTIGSGNTQVATNNSGFTFVAWNWLEGATQGFDIITGTGGTAVNHNLGVAPDFVIFKYRNATSDWNVYHKDVTSTSQRLKLNSTAAVESISASWTINSTNFAYGGGSNTWVAYLFAEVEGYSKFGSYTGNGNADGPFVFCNFRPAWVLTKRTDSTSAWYLHDTVRNTYNVVNLALSPDLSDAEVSANNNLDILSNGFKLRTSGAWMNASGGTYIFMALAENPFGGDGVSPATAR